MSIVSLSISFTNNDLIKTSSTQVTISGLIRGSTYYFKLKSNNGIDSNTF